MLEQATGASSAVIGRDWWTPPWLTRHQKSRCGAPGASGTHPSICLCSGASLNGHRRRGRSMSLMNLRGSAGLIGLLALAVVTAVLVALAINHVRPVQSATTATPAPPPVTSSPSGGRTATSEGSPGESASPSASPSERDEDSGTNEPTTEAVRQLLGGEDPVVVSVLGDGSGNGSDEWVALWAEEVAADADVTYRVWSETEAAFGAPERLSDSGTEIDIWNGSRPAETAAGAATSLQELQPEQPALVLISVGHSETESEVVEGLDVLWSDITRGNDEAIGVLVLQNPAQDEAAGDQRAVTDLARRWASDNELPVIDVYRAFEEAPRPLGDYLFDNEYPNEAGSELWADTVSAALGG